jgi:putative endonuclease
MNSKASWCIYIVQCNDGSFYTGITNNLERRLQEHNQGRAGAKYTRSRRPVSLVYHEEALSRSAAARREYYIKQMTLSEKIELIKTAGTSSEIC